MNGNIELYTNDVNMTDTEVCVYTRWVNNFFFSLFIFLFLYVTLFFSQNGILPKTQRKDIGESSLLSIKGPFFILW